MPANCSQFINANDKDNPAYAIEFADSGRLHPKLFTHDSAAQYVTDMAEAEVVVIARKLCIRHLV